MRRRGTLLCVLGLWLSLVVGFLLLAPAVSPLLGRMDPSTHNRTAGPCPLPQPPGHPGPTPHQAQGPPCSTISPGYDRGSCAASPSTSLPESPSPHALERSLSSLSCHLLELLVGWLFCLTHPHRPLRNKLLLILCEPSSIHRSPVLCFLSSFSLPLSRYNPSCSLQAASCCAVSKYGLLLSKS